jgi:hypothetical protein
VIHPLFSIPLRQDSHGAKVILAILEHAQKTILNLPINRLNERHPIPSLGILDPKSET